MRGSKLLLAAGSLAALIAGLSLTYLSLSRSIPSIEVVPLTSLPQDPGQPSLPFFELMSPLPRSSDHWLLPRLEYVKGPPERYLERIQLLVVSQKVGPKERIFYYGRRSREDWRQAFALNHGLDLAAFYQNAFLYSLGKETKFIDSLPFYKRLVMSYIFLSESSEWLRDVQKLSILDQAGTPAFLFEYKKPEGAPTRAKMWFFRHNSLYQVELRADEKFVVLHPTEIFQQSFLSEKRQDALAFVAQHLSLVRFDSNQADQLSPQSLAWPMALLVAHLSLDPASLESYFHFAGLSALLYKSRALDSADIESLDILRNNVLSAELFSKDIDPNGAKSAEIGHLARNLVRGFQ